MSNDLICSKRAAAYLNIQPDTLAKWRCLAKKDPKYRIPFTKYIGKLVFYKKSDLDDFLEQSRKSW
jgi:hypothetical protein